MPITKEERLARKQQHTKQERISVLDGVPSSDEVREGVPVLRDTNEGLIEYVKHKGVLHATPKGASSSTVTTFASSAVRGSGVDGASPSSGFSGDHGVLTGLSDDDHTTYILVDGTRAFSGRAIVDDTTDATSKTDGSLQTDGGLSVAKAIYNGTAATLAADSGVVTIGSTTAATFSAAGLLNVNNATEATSTTDGSLQTDGGLSVVKDAIFGNDVKLLTDASVFSMGVGSDFTITHDNSDGGTIAGRPVTITSGSAATWSTSAGNLTVDAAAAVLVLDGHTGITLDASNSGNIEINVTAADDILIGNDAVAQDILIGNAAATQVDLTAILVDINGGSSGVTIDGDVNINSYALTNSDPYTVSIKPNNSTQHMTMGLADKQNNYSMLGIFSAAAAAISGVSADDWSWDT